MSDVRETGSETGALLQALARTPEPARQRAAGERVGRFVIDGALGRGGMGIVYRARDTVLGRVVALKMVRDPARSSDLAGRFHREARAGACIADRRVAAVHDLFEHEGELVLALQLVEGRTLRARLREGPLDVAEATRLAQGIAAGLAAAHAAGVVHRDLKPENVMIEPGGEPVLLDFGLALFTRPEPSEVTGPEPHPTGAGVVGTLHYASPEQLAGSGVGPASDVFTFGVVLHELLTGARPFGGDDAPGLLVGNREVPPLGPAIPPALARVAVRCLAKDPSARYPSARELVAALAGERREGDTPRAAPATGRAGLRRAPFVVAALTLGLGGFGAARWLAAKPGAPAAAAPASTVPRAPSAEARSDASAETETPGRTAAPSASTPAAPTERRQASVRLPRASPPLPPSAVPAPTPPRDAFGEDRK